MGANDIAIIIPDDIICELNKCCVENEVGGILLGHLIECNINDVTEIDCINSLHSTIIHDRRDVKKAQSIINKRWRNKW